MITRAQVLRTWADRWRTLRAWRRDLSNVTVEITDKSLKTRAGFCDTKDQRVVIHVGKSLVDDLATVLHELAHAAAYTGHHDERWQTLFATAVSEATGLTVIPVAYNFRLLDHAATSAVATWWKASGNEAILKLSRL